LSDDPSKPPGDVQPLEYRNPADDKPARARHVWATAAGVIMGTAAVLVSVFSWIIVNIESDRINWIAPLAVTVTAFGLPGAIAAYLYNLRGNKFFFYGLLIGVLLGLLVEGVCFAANR
jgi:hypothetical protein